MTKAEGGTTRYEAASTLLRLANQLLASRVCGRRDLDLDLSSPFSPTKKVPSCQRMHQLTGSGIRHDTTHIFDCTHGTRSTRLDDTSHNPRAYTLLAHCLFQSPTRAAAGSGQQQHLLQATTEILSARLINGQRSVAAARLSVAGERAGGW